MATTPNGNRTSLGGSSSVAYTIAAASNRLLGSKARHASLRYDADGNVTVDNQPMTILGYTYDASGGWSRPRPAPTRPPTPMTGSASG